MIVLKSIVIILTIMLLGACATTKEGKAPEHTGFLRAPQLMTAGKPGQAQQVYFKPDVDWAKYDKVQLYPVTVWRGKESQFKGVKPADAQKMADYFFSLIHTALAKDYQMVTSPQPNTLRVSAAIIKLKEADVAIETVSTVVPQARLLTSLANFGSNNLCNARKGTDCVTPANK